MVTHKRYCTCRSHAAPQRRETGNDDKLPEQKKKKEKLTQGQMRQNAGNHDIQPECKSQTEQSRTKTGVFHQVR